MKRFALLLALALAGTPALAGDCSRVTDRVDFCPAGTSWDGIAGEYVERLKVTGYRGAETALMLGVAPDFAREAWDGTEAGLTAVIDSFGNGVTVLEPASLDATRPMAHGAFALPQEMVALVTVFKSGDELIVAQTLHPGTELTEAHRADHQAALQSLVEDVP